LREAGGEVDRGRRLADAALLVGKRVHPAGHTITLATRADVSWQRRDGAGSLPESVQASAERAAPAAIPRVLPRAARPLARRGLPRHSGLRTGPPHRLERRAAGTIRLRPAGSPAPSRAPRPSCRPAAPPPDRRQPGHSATRGP